MRFDLLQALYSRNEVLFGFGSINLILAVLFIGFSFFSDKHIMGVNAWYKPIKFALSIGIYAWTMAWFTHYLGRGTEIGVFNWVIVCTLGFEILYIAIQAGRGQRSHFNLSTSFYSSMYGLMALAATLACLATAYIGFRFFSQNFPTLPLYYVWGIRLGIVLFVIFSLEGFVMGARLSHTIGGPDGGKGLPFLNWSRKFGDPRIAHFLGMHALQVLPCSSYFLLKDVGLTIGLGLLYAGLASYVLIQALRGQPFWGLPL